MREASRRGSLLLLLLLQSSRDPVVVVAALVIEGIYRVSCCTDRRGRNNSSATQSHGLEGAQGDIAFPRLALVLAQLSPFIRHYVHKTASWF
ncbi:uncharacterized protein HKW66_Vig0201470 [Vigna angularis]|uniref:Secreted protein n=1 Tax=Phaseolus angularis TaxID=3914 RepID=A0A8T0JR88_PHAAN|nr:uncharacterized protein HKW66_Vig0201470 [Vigna angularis]